MGSKEYNKQYGLTKKDVSAGAQVDKIYERQLKRIKELRAKGFTDEQIDNDKIIKQTKEDMKNVGKKSESKPVNDPKLAKEIENGDHFERQKKEAAQKKRDEKLRQERREGEARADDFRKKVESGEIVYNKETGKFEDGKKPAEKTENKSARAQEFIKIPTANGYAKVPKDAYSKYANNPKTNVRLSKYIGEKMKGKSSRESNKLYDFVVKKIYESGDDPSPYLSQGGYSYPQRLLDMYYDEWNSKTNDCAPRVLTKDTKIRVRKA